eukprot:Partr_v1_DN28798_c0_g2_i1_m61944
MSDTVRATTISYLTADLDNSASEIPVADYLVRVYLGLARYDEAVQIAVSSARKDQATGNYRQARNTLMACLKKFRELSMEYPVDAYELLTNLHSYILVKVKFLAD